MKTTEPFRTAAEVLALNALRAIAGAGPDVDTRELAALYVADVEAAIASKDIESLLCVGGAYRLRV